jgi:tRNA(Ile)-lysidine synthase
VGRTRTRPAGARALVDAVRAAVWRHRLLDRGDRVLVAVSGGPDSVALLDALVQLRVEWDLSLRVCHVHHGLRAEANADAAFVEALARRLGCPVTVAHAPVVLGAGRSPEDAARVARHAALARAADAHGATRIALGHTADDQAETVLMRVLDGAGPRGLAGIPVRRGRVIRPLLDVDRPAVLAHLEAQGLAHVEDATNRDRAFRRNRIRHDLLPLLRAHAGPAVMAALRRTARASREAVEALDALLAPRLADRLARTPAGARLDLRALDGLPAGAVKTLLRLALGAGRPGGLAADGLRVGHLDALAGLVGSPVGALVRLPGAVVVERGRDALWLLACGPAPPPAVVAVPGGTAWERLDLAAEVATPPAGLPGDGTWEAWFDRDALGGPLVLRRAGPSDSLVPFGAGRAVTVGRLLAGVGVPPRAREAWPVLATGDTVAWLVGVRRAALAPVTGATRTVLRLRVALSPGPGPEAPAPG